MMALALAQAQAGFNLDFLAELCRKERAWFEFVEEYELTMLCSPNPTLRGTAKDLIELCGRSETVFNFVYGVKEYGSEAFIAYTRAPELIDILVEAGYDLPELQRIAAPEVHAHGSWSQEQISATVETLLDDNTASLALQEEAVELILLYLEKEVASALVTGVVEMGLDVCENTGDIIEGIGELIRSLFE